MAEAEVKLNRRARVIQAAIERVEEALERDDWRTEVDRADLYKLSRAAGILLAATEPASDEEAVRDVLAIQIPGSVNEITAARNGYIAVSAYRAAEARVRRLAFGEEG